MTLSGTVVPMATPSDRRRGTVDEETLVSFTEWLDDSGVDGLFPGSSIGEFSSLTDDQHETVVRTVARTAAEDKHVLAGCCDTSVAGTVSRIETAVDAGADAAVVIVPYYLSTDQRGLRSFFRRVADQSPLPLLLYNIPPLAGTELAVETVVDLADHERIAGLKDTSGDLNYHHAVIEETPDDFAVYQGATQLAAQSLTLGADGLIAGPANYLPGVVTDLTDAAAAGDHETVEAVTRSVVAPLVREMNEVPTAAAVKYLVARAGIDVGLPLPPLPTLSDDERRALGETYETVTSRVADGALVEH